MVRKLQERKLTLDVTGLSLCREQCLHGRVARPKRLIDRGWPKRGAAWGMTGEASGEPAGRRLCHLVFDIGLSGKPLYTKRADAFSASVSASSGDALATANGARVERQRRSGRGR